MPGARERLLEATYACVARFGMAKTTVEDVAREAGLSRATVYRHMPGGKDQLVREVVAWEAQRFFLRLGEAVSGAPDLASMLEEALVFAHRAVEEHEVLQKVLQTEPEVLLPLLTVNANRLLHLIEAFLAPHVAAAPLRPGVRPEDATGFLARMVLSHIPSAGCWELGDREAARELVRTQLLPGVLAP